MIIVKRPFLKCCPFCGEDASLIARVEVYDGGEEVRDFVVECEWCATCTSGHKTAKEAANFWNGSGTREMTVEDLLNGVRRNGVLETPVADVESLPLVDGSSTKSLVEAVLNLALGRVVEDERVSE